MATSSNAQLVIGLVGEKGAGKETVSKIISSLVAPKTVYHTAFSDLLSKTLTDWNLPLTRTNLQNLAIIMRKTFGENVLSQATFHRIQTSAVDIVILDGVRWESDRLLIRQFPSNSLVYITATPEIRYQRLVSRKQKHGEGNTTFSQFLQEEQARTELEIPRIGLTADFKIINNGSMADLKTQVKQLCRQFIAH